MTTYTWRIKLTWSKACKELKRVPLIKFQQSTMGRLQVILSNIQMPSCILIGCIFYWLGLNGTTVASGIEKFIRNILNSYLFLFFNFFFQERQRYVALCFNRTSFALIFFSRPFMYIKYLCFIKSIQNSFKKKTLVTDCMS